MRKRRFSVVCCVFVLWTIGAHAGVTVNANPTAKQKDPSELAEVTRILTKGKGPTVDKGKAAKQQFTVMDPKWDPKRAWLVEFKLTGQKLVVIGGALTTTDVLQFAKRMQLSKFFDRVVMMRGQRKKNKKIGEYYEFEISATAPDADPTAEPVVIRKTGA